MESIQFFCSESRVEDNQNIYGRFKLSPFLPGQAVTLVNGLRRCLLSEISGIAITAIKIKGVEHEYSTVVGLRESVLDILLNVKQVVLTSEFQFEQPQVAYLRVQGPGIARANDIKLPMSIQNVKPEQHIATLLYDGVLDIKFMICSGKNSLVQTPRGLRTPKLLKTKPPHRFTALQNKGEMMIFSLFLKKNINNSKAKPLLSRTQFVTAPLTFLKQKQKRKIKPYADLVFYRDKSQEEMELEARAKGSEMPILPTTLGRVANKEAETLQAKLVIKDVNNVFFDAVFLPIDAVFAPVLRVNFAIEENDLSNAPKECVILEVWTNGSIHPIQAIVEASKALTNITGLLEGVTNSKPLFINSLKSFHKALTYNNVLREEELRVKSFKGGRVGRSLLQNDINREESLRLREALRFGYRSLFLDGLEGRRRDGDDADDDEMYLFLDTEDVLLLKDSCRPPVSIVDHRLDLSRLLIISQKRDRLRLLRERLADKDLRNLTKEEVNWLVRRLIVFATRRADRHTPETPKDYLFAYNKRLKEYDWVGEGDWSLPSSQEDIDNLANKTVKSVDGRCKGFFRHTLPTLVLSSLFREHFSEMKKRLLRTPLKSLDLSVDIGNLGLSLRSYTCLKRAKIESVSDLLQRSCDDLLSVEGFGKDSLKEVENSLHRLDLKTAPSP